VPTTDSSFPRLAFENGILDTAHSAPPGNLDYLQDRLDRARNTASPTESEYQDFTYRIQRAPNEMTMVLETSTLLKRYGRGYRRVYNQAFNDFPKDVGLNNGLSAAQPDMVEGLDMTEFDPVPIRRELGGSAVPTGELDPPTLPHFAGEWKGPGKDMVLAQTQAAYDGACMTYARNKARSFLENPDPAGHAFVSTFTTDGTILNTFADYSSETQGQVKYHHYPTSSSLLIATYEDHKKSRRRLRNQEDDAKEAAEKLRDELHEKWSANQQSLVTPSVPPETADPTDYNNYDYDDEEDPSNQLLAECRTSFPANDQYDSSGQIPAPSYAIFPANDEDDPFIQVSTASNGYTSPNGLILPLVTPPQSLEDTSLPLDQSNGRGHRKTRRIRKPVVIVDARKTRRKP
jgi:hypothetical protein